MEQRHQPDRRGDTGTAERFDMAVRTVLAFDLKAAANYLALSGVAGQVIQSFLERFPHRIRSIGTLPWLPHERRVAAMRRTY